MRDRHKENTDIRNGVDAAGIKPPRASIGGATSQKCRRQTVKDKDQAREADKLLPMTASLGEYSTGILGPT